MNTVCHRWWSRHLRQDMELKVYGHAGKPVLVFPCQGGQFYEYEDFGMVEACVGQGTWEYALIADTREPQGILSSKEIPAWIDFWRHDVDHDWPRWRRQMPYFLEHINL